MLTPNTSQQYNPDYPTASISDFINEMNQPKQDFGIDINPEQSDDDLSMFTYGAGEEDADETVDNEKVDIQMKAAAARSGGKLVATVIDSALPATLAYFAEESPEQFKATEAEKEDLTEALTEYMRLKGGDIPPGIMVIILVCAIYGCRIPEVMKLRKTKQEEKEERKRLEKEERKQQTQTQHNEDDTATEDN